MPLNTTLNSNKTSLNGRRSERNIDITIIVEENVVEICVTAYQRTKTPHARLGSWVKFL